VLAGGRVLAEGTPIALAEALAGRVWRGPAEAYGGEAALLSRRLSNGRRTARVLADERPGPAFDPVPATLEDAYFAALVEETER
jgi:hypothetical protein